MPFSWCVSVCHFCQVPSVFYPLLAAIFCQGRSPWWHRVTWGEHLSPHLQLCQESLNVLKITYTICLWWQLSSLQEVMANNLPLLCNVSQMLYLSTLPFPQSCLKTWLWRLFPYYQGTHVLYPVTRGLWLEEMCVVLEIDCNSLLIPIWEWLLVLWLLLDLPFLWGSHK